MTLDEHATHERVAIGVDAARREAEDDVPRLHLRPIDHLGPVNHAHAEAGEVVFCRLHDAGMLGHLAAHQGAAGLTAPLGYAGDDLRGELCVERADRDVVEEEERLCAAGEDVVRAHGDQIDANRLVPAQQLREPEFGAHAVGPAHEYRVAHLLERRSAEQPAKAADVADDLAAVRRADGVADEVDRARSLGGVHTGVAVGRRAGVVAVAHLMSFVAPRGLISSMWRIPLASGASPSDACRPGRT